MVKHPKKKVARHLLAASALAVGVAGAAYAAKHEAIVLRDHTGTAIPFEGEGSDKAFSIKKTCFTSECHATADGGSKALKTGYSYNEIERHNYHTSLGMSEYRGFNPANPDAHNPYTAVTANAGDKWRSGAGPDKKTWVSSPGHVGSW